MIQILAIPALSDNYIWCLHNGNQCVLVDPGESFPALNVIKENNFDLCAILITHHHYDHTNGVKDLLKFKSVPVIGPATISQVTHPLLTNTFWIKEFDLDFYVIQVPGHTLEHVAYYANRVVFTGDTLFTAGCGKIFEGTVQQMYDSLQKIQSLPDDTYVYCGHEYTESNLQFASAVEPDNQDILKRFQETLALRKQQTPTVPALLSLEKKTNPFLRCEQPTVINAASHYSKSLLSDPVEVLQVLREWKNSGDYPVLK